MGQFILGHDYGYLEVSSILFIRRKLDRQIAQSNHQRICRNNARQQRLEILPFDQELAAKMRNRSVHLYQRVSRHHFC